MMSSNVFGIRGENSSAISQKIVASTLNTIQQLLPESPSATAAGGVGAALCVHQPEGPEVSRSLRLLERPS